MRTYLRCVAIDINDKEREWEWQEGGKGTGNKNIAKKNQIEPIFSVGIKTRTIKQRKMEEARKKGKTMNIHAYK